MIDVSKKIKKNIGEKQKGITLLALVITIVVLLIIAGISISMLTGENGTIKQAGNAKLLNEIGTIKEAIDMKDVEKQEDDNYNKRQTFGSITDVLGEEYKNYNLRNAKINIRNL